MNAPLSLCRISLLAAAVIATGCASAPRTNSEVARLQDELRDMRGDSRIAPHAAAELREAELAVQVLVEQRRMPPEDFDQNLYLAGRLVDIAGAEGLARHATQVGEELDRERETMLLAARTREADAARLVADRERMRADEAQLANRRAQTDADMAQREADAARLQSANEQLGAERGLREAELARSEADAARADADAAREAMHQMEIELADLQAKQTERGLVVTVGDVLFEVDRADLRPGEQRELDKLVAALRDRRGFDLAIEGHTDSTGSAEHNLDLSERRAASVRRYLTAQGIDSDRSTSIGLGQDHPVADNDNASGRQQNRRVEIVIRQAETRQVGVVNTD